MSDYVFLFDLDSTLTRCEILPMLAEKLGNAERMRQMTEETMRGERPFSESFSERVRMLSELPVSAVAEQVAAVPLNRKMTEFVRRHPERCYVVTGNVDCWIEELLRPLLPAEHIICSQALLENGYIRSLRTVVDKGEAAARFTAPLVVIGDGDNDVPMARRAEIVIGFGGVREIAPGLRDLCTRSFTDESECAAFLETLL